MLDRTPCAGYTIGYRNSRITCASNFGGGVMQQQYECHNEDSVLGVGEHIPAEHVDLVIAAPPQEGAAAFESEEAWRVWSEAWLLHVNRVLRRGGSCYLLGPFTLLSELLPIAQGVGLKLRQQIVVDKSNTSTPARSGTGKRMFPGAADNLLLLYRDQMPFVRGLLKAQQTILGLTGRAINEALGVGAKGGGMWSNYTGTGGQMPTREHWEKLQEVLDFYYPYDRLAPVFQPTGKLTNVWRDLDFSDAKLGRSGRPIELLERLIVTSSHEGEAVLDPFAGEGDTGLAALRTGRFFYGFEADPQKFQIMEKRLEEYVAYYQYDQIGLEAKPEQ